MRRRSGFLASIALVAALSLFGCKQGRGEHCQIDSDCEDGLECNQEGSDMVCGPPGGGGIDAGPDYDAMPRPDASAVDAAPVDAGAVDGAAVDA